MFQHNSHVSTRLYVSQCSGEADGFGHFLSFTCLRRWLLNWKVFPQSLQAYFSIALCVSLWDSRFHTSGFSYEQSGHLCMIPSSLYELQTKYTCKQFFESSGKTMDKCPSYDEAQVLIKH